MTEHITTLIVAQRIVDVLAGLAYANDWQEPIYHRNPVERQGVITYGSLGKLVGYEFTNDGLFSEALDLAVRHSHLLYEENLVRRVVKANTGYPNEKYVAA